MVIDPVTAPHFTRPRHLVDAPVALAAYIAATEACSNSDPDVMGEALDNAVAIAQGALRACQHHKTRLVAPRLRPLARSWTPRLLNKENPDAPF